MGLNANRVQMLLDAKKQGVEFKNTLILGRQKIWMSPKQYKYLKGKYGITGKSTGEIVFNDRVYADDFLKKNFNIEKLSILDYSQYEKADTIVDLNYKIPQTHFNSYDVVIDGGTLEHVFNFPVAIANCMNMVKVGGSIFIFSMANNHCGHGFYQFSPELFFRIFDENNGFIAKSVVLVEHPYPSAELSSKSRCYTVKDPMKAGIRGTVLSRSPLGIMVHAIKQTNKPVFMSSPLQSDYLVKWDEKKSRATKISIMKYLRSKYLGFRIINFIKGELQKHHYNIKNNNKLFNKTN